MGETAKLVFGVLTVVTFAVAFPVALVSWFRILRAKTRKEYWKNIALFVIPILLVFLFAELAGFDTGGGETAPLSTAQVPDPLDLLSRMPTAQLVLLAIAATIWLVGGNMLMHMHNKRLGKRWWQILNPLDPPLKDFNRNEWWILGGLVLATFVFGILAMSIDHPGRSSPNQSLQPTPNGAAEFRR